MNRKPPTKPKWSFGGCLLNCLLWIVGILLLFCIEPTYTLLKEKWIIDSAVSRAKSIKIVHYNPHSFLLPEEIVYDTKELKPEEFYKVSRAFPVFLDIGDPFGQGSCIFDPHHRIVITDAEGKETIIRVCFNCDHVSIGKEYALGTPFVWRLSLRHFFDSEGLPYQPDRYQKDLQEYWKTHPSK